MLTILMAVISPLLDRWMPPPKPLDESAEPTALPSDDEIDQAMAP